MSIPFPLPDGSILARRDEILAGLAPLLPSEALITTEDERREEGVLVDHPAHSGFDACDGGLEPADHRLLTVPPDTQNVTSLGGVPAHQRPNCDISS